MRQPQSSRGDPSLRLAIIPRMCVHMGQQRDKDLLYLKEAKSHSLTTVQHLLCPTSVENT